MRIRIGTGLISLLACGASLGCNSFDEPVTDEDMGPKLVIPTDERLVTTSPVTPLPISGGTLTVAANGQYAVASDPERDRISIVDLSTLGVRSTIELQQGAEPGRVVESTDGLVHVALRGSGEVVTVDTATGIVRGRQAVCKSPRGIAFDQTTFKLHVACVEGALVSLNAADLAIERTLQLDTDLRDVVVQGSELWVTRFKSAEVIRVDAQGVITSRATPVQAKGLLNQPAPESEREFGPTVMKEVALQPEVAWRTVSSPAGGAIMIHQEAVVDDIEISEPTPDGGSAYGGSAGGFDCSSGIVKNVVTAINSDGSTFSAPFTGPPLPVDVAVSQDQQWIAVAHAGTPDLEAPRPTVVFRSEFGDSVQPTSGNFLFASSVSILPLYGASSDCNFASSGVVDAQVTAVAFAPNGALVVQTREPAQVGLITDSPWGSPVFVDLGGETRKDTGHELFHRDSGGGIACASCHPEATEDGHVWSFAGTGLRRTQPLHVGLRDTAPFHWAGDLPNLGSLMTDVFVGRMGGVHQSAPRLGSLSEWLFGLEAPPALRDPGDEAALRGKEIFESPGVGCATCHSGEKLTNNLSVAIKSSVDAGKLQVPSLVGIAYRAPFMHDGCAATLQARFDPACGGDLHGNTADLAPEQIGDLIAYLETL